MGLWKVVSYPGDEGTRFSSSNLPGWFFGEVAYFTQMKRKFIERDNQTRMGRIEAEHVNYVFGLGGEEICLVWICHFFFRWCHVLPVAMKSRETLLQTNACSKWMGLGKGKSNWNCYIALFHEILVYLQKKSPVWLANIGKMMQRI